MNLSSSAVFGTIGQEGAPPYIVFDLEDRKLHRVRYPAGNYLQSCGHLVDKLELMIWQGS